METSIRTITTSELLRLSLPLTGAVSLQCLHPPNPPPHHHPPQDPTPAHIDPAGTFHPLNQSTVLLGTVSLPRRDAVATCGANNPCLTFSDDSSSTALCCAVLKADPDMIGKKICVLAWNYVPFDDRGTGGLLEIIHWSFADRGMGTPAEPVHSSRPPIWGLVESVSPVFKAPCASSGSKSDVDLFGFLVELLTCECSFCKKGRSDCSENRHEFTKTVFMYFRGTCASWHPVVSKLVGSLIAVSGLKKKLVVVEGEEPYVMRVSTEDTIVSKWRGLAEMSHPKRGASHSRSKLGCYDGVVTGVYMQGMVLELDERVWLLLTDRLLAPSHSVRVGAVITVRNVHIICPKLSWTRELVLGSCLKTTIDVKSFSVCSAKSPGILRSQSLLGDFIGSLCFSARFWVLLLVACFRRKFVGIFTDREILGSKNKEGFVQSYARLHLQSTAERQHGVFFDFCKHDDAGCGRNCPENGTLKLVAPLSNFLNNCTAVLMTVRSEGLDGAECPGPNNYDRDFFCEGSYHARIRRRFVSGDVLGIVLVGCIQISRTSRRLQLIDATGGIDVVVPDLPTDHDEQTIYEVKNYNIVLEWEPSKVESFASALNMPLSCRSIFQVSAHHMLNGPTIYVHFYFRNSNCLNALLQCPFGGINEQPGSNSAFHLLMVAHKFPAQHDFVDDSMSNRLSTFAEAFLLPYNLILLDKYDDIQKQSSDKTVNAKNGTDDDMFVFAGGWMPRLINIDKDEISVAGSAKDSIDGRDKPYEFPCLLAHSTCKSRGILIFPRFFPANESSSGIAASRMKPVKLLLEFKSDLFNKFQSLCVGGLYLLKCSDVGFLDHMTKKLYILDRGKLTVNRQKPFWKFSFMVDGRPSPNDLLQLQSRGFPLDGAYKFTSELLPNILLHFHQNLTGLQWNCDAQILITSESMEFLRTVVHTEIDGLINPLPIFSEICSVSSCIKIIHGPSAHSPGTTTPSSRHLEGKMISLCGDVVGVHFLNKSFNFSCYPRSGYFYEIHQSRTHEVCIHVCEDNHLVKIRGILGKCILPLGFGSGANATFYRLLITRNIGWNELALVPASHIVINFVREALIHDSSSSCLQPMGLVPTKHAYDDAFLGLAGLENKTKFRCRVSGIFYLMLQKRKLRSRRIKSLKCGLNISAKIPIAAFILDDGSSLCCCWADADKAETLLRLRDVISCTYLGRMTSKRSGTKMILDTVGSCLDEVLKKHGCITATSCGAVLDSSSADATFHVKSRKVLGKFEEKILKSIILYASGGPTFDVIGSKMDFDTLRCLKKGLINIHMARDLPIQHIWAVDVLKTDPLAAARSLLDELL